MPVAIARSDAGRGACLPRGHEEGRAARPGGTDVVALTVGSLTSGIAAKIRAAGPDGKEIPVGQPLVTDTDGHHRSRCDGRACSGSPPRAWSHRSRYGCRLDIVVMGLPCLTASQAASACSQAERPRSSRGRPGGLQDRPALSVPADAGGSTSCRPPAWPRRAEADAPSVVAPWRAGPRPAPRLMWAGDCVDCARTPGCSTAGVAATPALRGRAEQVAIPVPRPA